MSLRILGGVARQFELAAPHLSSTRPTSVMLKRRLFDAIQNFSGTTFVDLCAGSGSIGLEALSRGADEVFLIESHPKVVSVLKKNTSRIKEKFSELGAVHAISSNAVSWLAKNHSLLQGKELFLFFDPPYEDLDLYESFFKLINEVELSARIIVEACEQKTMKLSDFKEKFGEGTKVYQKGTSFFIIYDL